MKAFCLTLCIIDRLSAGVSFRAELGLEIALRCESKREVWVISPRLVATGLLGQYGHFFFPLDCRLSQRSQDRSTEWMLKAE